MVSLVIHVQKGSKMGEKSTKMGHMGHFRGMKLGQKGQKQAKNVSVGSFLRSEVGPKKSDLGQKNPAKKNPANKNLNPAKKN